MCRAWGVFDVGAAVVGNAAKKLQRHPVEAGSRDPDTHDVIGYKRMGALIIRIGSRGQLCYTYAKKPPEWYW